MNFKELKEYITENSTRELDEHLLADRLLEIDVLLSNEKLNFHSADLKSSLGILSDREIKIYSESLEVYVSHSQFFLMLESLMESHNISKELVKIGDRISAEEHDSIEDIIKSTNMMKRITSEINKHTKIINFLKELTQDPRNRLYFSDRISYICTYSKDKKGELEHGFTPRFKDSFVSFIFDNSKIQPTKVYFYAVDGIFFSISEHDSQEIFDFIHEHNGLLVATEYVKYSGVSLDLLKYVAFMNRNHEIEIFQKQGNKFMEVKQ
ncbi:hypothetical protein ABET51_06690 [Metabacillus fastidiosus]|uniref:hypothetical protein n=1 Tax=Metabacillus fastidiosus TaxID=1458 RepID=UPI003D2B1672